MLHSEQTTRVGRSATSLRAITLERGASAFAEGSCLITFGDTRVLCTASVEDGVPGWRKGSGLGWITAEYAMLPRATHTRTPRERAQLGGRTQEIQRLIGRSVRANGERERLAQDLRSPTAARVPRASREPASRSSTRSRGWRAPSASRPPR